MHLSLLPSSHLSTGKPWQMLPEFPHTFFPAGKLHLPVPIHPSELDAHFPLLSSPNRCSQSSLTPFALQVGSSLHKFSITCSCSSLTPNHFTLDALRVSLVPYALQDAYLPLPSSPTDVPSPLPSCYLAGKFFPQKIHHHMLIPNANHFTLDTPSPLHHVPQQVRFSL
ncbi:hypothetical protein EDD16DRAFT_1517949 [Pisolithus croceorrhizus]|nr:hypothetical protein EDD16DRAFT_1517949 [Pisolithus croceorrhizus]